MKLAYVIPLLFFGCATQQVPLDPYAAIRLPDVPPLPKKALSSPRSVPRVASVPAPRITNVVVLAYDCQLNVLADELESGIEASADLKNWTEVARTNYASNVVIRLTNRPSYELYRAFVRWKN